jgi:CopG family transcriptional regulator, nickel-responsive regulator
MSLVRFGVSMEEELVTLLDDLARREQYANRSEALRSLVRRRLAQEAAPPGRDREDQRTVAGIVTLLYPYDRTLLRAPLAPFPTLRIAANLQLHLQDQVCLKMLVVQGAASEVHQWAQPVVAQKGVVGNLSVVATEDVCSALIS